MNESNVIYTVFWASMPRFKELPDAISPSLLMAAGLPSSMVAILLKSSLFHPPTQIFSFLVLEKEKKRQGLPSTNLPTTDSIGPESFKKRKKFRSQLIKQ